MEVGSPIVSGEVVETGQPLCGSIYSTIKNIVKGPQQLRVFEKKMISVMALRADATTEMESAKRDGKVIKAQATEWLDEVKELERKINDQIQEAESSRCFLSCITKRYGISRLVSEHLKEIERLLDVGSSLAGSVALNYSEFKAVEHIPGPSIQDQTVSEDLAKVMTLLFDDRFWTIGIWGMGGVGKTNLVRNLNNELLEMNSNMPFTCVLWVTVSKNLDIKRLQMEIASRLGLHLEESSGADGMATQLYRRLQAESFLLILDDVWEKIDLNKLGVPRPDEDHKGCKIILTSRSLDVCRSMQTDVVFKVSVLRYKDAWQLFSRHVGDVVSSADITPLAEAICIECMGLPLAIITMGAAMRGKMNPAIWKHALNQLRRSAPSAVGVEDELYKRLLDVGSSLAGSVALNYSEFKAVEHIPGPSIQDQTVSVSEDLSRVMALLFDNRFWTIGIWGMGGVGKTNLVRNLNNKLLEMNSNMPFTCVVWVTVSINLDIKRLQMGIATRLGLHLEESSGAVGMAIQLYRRLQAESFLLILDDVWEKIDLDELGVPRPEDHKGCKIILTSRSLDVCRCMQTDYQVKISVLRDIDAWQLFSRYAGDVVSSAHITPLAEAICRECMGLPLAIITMGAAMRRKTNPEVWKYALNQLRRSVPIAAGVEEELYKTLKWSYDSLEGEDLKTCFLYCSLFPKDFSIKIDELVWYWLAEGLIDDRQNYEDFYCRGISLIENLKDACLLEDGSDEGTVKMHGVVRDCSIWIASTCSEDGSTSLVRSGCGLIEISPTELSNSLKRVSVMDNDLERLPDDSMIRHSKASTLLLQNNHRLDLIPERFLEGFKALRVLNISETRIKSLPVSLLQLDDLRALVLNNCRDLEELPPLESLSRLQVLDLSCNGIRELPRGLEQLCNLRYLNLRSTDRLKAIQARVISKLSNLEVLDISDMGYIWKVKGGVNEEQASIEELQCLKRLLVLSITLEWIPSHGSPQDTIISLTNSLVAFRIEIRGPGDSPKSGSPLSRQFWQTISGEPLPLLSDGRRSVILDGIDLTGGQIGCWLSNASDLFLKSCGRLNEILQDLVIESDGRSFTYLKKLVLFDSESIFQTGGHAAHYDLLPNLKEFWLIEITGIESISELVNHLGLRFQRLETIVVIDCREMKYLLSLGNSIRTMPNLEVIQVRDCPNLEELFNYPPSQINVATDPITPNLKKLKLASLPKLRNLCRDRKDRLGIYLQVDVFECDLLGIDNSHLLSVGGENLSDNRVLSSSCSNRMGVQGDVGAAHEITTNSEEFDSEEIASSSQQQLQISC